MNQYLYLKRKWEILINEKKQVYSVSYIINNICNIFFHTNYASQKNHVKMY